MLSSTRNSYKYLRPLSKKASAKKTAPIIPVLLKYSEALKWEDARLEWYLIEIRLVDLECAETCACGHHPILEICFIKNKVSNTVLEVGNCCINQISPEFDTLNRIFPALKEGRINPVIITYAHERGIINNWERGFLSDTWRKLSLTFRQKEKFNRIRYKIYDNFEISSGQRQRIYQKWRVTRGSQAGSAAYLGVAAL